MWGTLKFFLIPAIVRRLLGKALAVAGHRRDK
jgi:hypothetical protein